MTGIVCIEDRKKIYVQLLAKLYIPDQIEDDKLRTLMLLIKNLRRVSPALLVVSIHIFLNVFFFLPVSAVLFKTRRHGMH